MLEELRTLAGLEAGEQEELLALYLAQAEEYVRCYCHIEAIPEGLKHTVCQMAADAFRQRGEGQVKSVKEGDSQVDYAEAAPDYRRQLDCYRRLKTI